MPLRAPKRPLKREGGTRVAPSPESNGFEEVSEVKSLISHDTEMPQNAGVGYVDQWGFVHRTPAGSRVRVSIAREEAPAASEASFTLPEKTGRLVRHNGRFQFQDKWGEMHYFSEKPYLPDLVALEAKEPSRGAATAAKSRTRPDGKVLRAPRRGYKGDLALYAWPA